MKASRYDSCFPAVYYVRLLTRLQAMRFPMNQHRLELKNAQEARERERELAKEIVEGELDEDDGPGGDFDGL